MEDIFISDLLEKEKILPHFIKRRIILKYTAYLIPNTCSRFLPAIKG